MMLRTCFFSVFCVPTTFRWRWRWRRRGRSSRGSETDEGRRRWRRRRVRHGRRRRGWTATAWRPVGDGSESLRRWCYSTWCSLLAGVCFSFARVISHFPPPHKELWALFMGSFSSGKFCVRRGRGVSFGAFADSRSLVVSFSLKLQSFASIWLDFTEYSRSRGFDKSWPSFRQGTHRVSWYTLHISRLHARELQFWGGGPSSANLRDLLPTNNHHAHTQ